MMNKILFFKRGDRTLSPTHRTLSPTHRTLSPKNRLFLSIKNDLKEEGFSILEVLVTILVITGFILGSLQATLLATFMRVQAQDKQEAANWVQQDLELIRYQAFDLVGTYDDDSDSSTAEVPATGNNASKASQCGSYGQALEDQLDPDIDNNGFDAYASVEINGKWYRVFRTFDSTDGTNETNILRVNYIVAYAPAISPNPAHPRYKSSSSYTVTTAPSTDNANVVTSLSTEVLPDAALSCGS